MKENAKYRAENAQAKKASTTRQPSYGGGVGASQVFQPQHLLVQQSNNNLAGALN
jgi:hypothetical protein